MKKADQAIILFAHGARDPEWAAPVRRIEEYLRAQAPQAHVDVAFLEFMTPSLNEAIDAAAVAGIRRVVVVPVFLASGGHLKRDVPVLVEAARLRHPGCGIELAPPIGEDEHVAQAIAACAARQL
ncbi:MAG: cobalamin biosynthesis protein CbiX [Zoogloea sp.]|nr:cobalamin biosynthesis protein CbiX [Zoogloea sp.]